MSDENQNEFKQWSEKLSQLDSLSGDPKFSKDGAWEKLHTRMAEKQKKPVAWYWMAAAAVLILSAGIWLANPRQKNNASLTATQLPQTPVDTLEKLNDQSQLTALKQVSDDVPKRAHPVKKLKRKIAITRNTIEIKEPIEENPSIVTEDKPLISMESIQSTIDTVRIARAPLKKMKVIHINEINALPTEAFAGKRFKNEPASSVINVSTPSLSMSRNSSDNILKLKISPSN